MSHGELLDLRNIIKLLPADGSRETNQQIYCEFDLSDIGEDSTKKLLSRISQRSKYIHTFAVSLHYTSDSPPTELLRLRRRGLQIPSNSTSTGDHGDSGWFQEFRKSASFYSSNDQFDQLASEIFSIAPPDKGKLVATIQIKKGIVEGILSDNYNLDTTQQNIGVWSSRSRLKQWVTDTKISTVLNELFKPDKLPIFVLLGDSNTIITSADCIQIIHIDDIDEFSNIDWEAHYREYDDYFSEVEDLFTSNPPLPARLFTSSDLRDLFQPVFLYGVFAGISDQITMNSDRITVRISSEKREIEDPISLSKDMSQEELSELSKFYTTFLERGTQNPYRTLWHRAIVEHCSSPEEISDNVSEIEHYYQSLEQNAIEGNFTELSGAVQDAQVFIGDVTNNLSNSTINTTNEIQKIVLALFTAVAGNVFLLVRRTDFVESAIFTTAFSAGILLLYFPTAQEKVDELSNIISEGESDADLYSDLIRSVGADELVDLERFSSRQQAYIDLAENRVSWAEEKLSQAFLLIIVVWSLSSCYVLLATPLFSIYSTVIIASAVASIWIGVRQTVREYQITANIIGYQIGIGLLPLMTILLTSAGLLIF